MKFAITATDRFLGVFEAFVSAGWEPLKLFTVPMSHPLSNQQAVINFAQQQQAAIQLSRMSVRDLADLQSQGCEVLIVASYDWKIHDWRPYLRYAVNFHSSPLPDGRGPYPACRAILENRSTWGITCHQISPQIDQGDILATESFPLQADECHESMDLKIQMAAKTLASRVARDFVPLWEQAQPQAAGHYWQKISFQDRCINFNQPVAEVLRHIRAYGSTESMANLNNNWFVVKKAVGWPELHHFPPGHVVHVFNRTLVVAAVDGYLGLLDCEHVPAHVIANAMTN